MPLYEYTCTDCRERFEVLQRMGEGSEGLTCPKCKSESVERQLSTFAGMASPGGSAGSFASSGCSPGSPFT